MRRALAAILALGAACAWEPSRDDAYEPPAVYREWFAAVEQCSGRRGDFDRLVFYDLTATDAGNGRHRFGWTVGKSIWIDPAVRMNRVVVSHELLHALAGGGHPAVPWTVPCHLWPVDYNDIVAGQPQP